MSSRALFLSRAAQSCAAPRRPFESMLLRGLVPPFLEKLAGLIAGRLRRSASFRIAASEAGAEQDSPQIYFVLRVFQSRLAFGLPPELVRLLGVGLLGVPLPVSIGEPAEEDLATLRELIVGILRAEEPFSKLAVFVEETLRAPLSETFGLEHELFVELELDAGSYLVPVRLDDSLLERIRIYGRIRAAPLLKRLKPNIAWSILGRRALGSFELILELVPGRRIPFGRLFAGSCELRQDTPDGARFALHYDSTLTFLRKKEA